MIESLSFNLDYDWKPFTFQRRHLTFEEHRLTRLNKTECSHWGATVYKWEGLLTQGTHVGKLGVLIGETQDLRQRIKQYLTGTQTSGNKYWREQFLTKGNIRLYILKFVQGKIQTPEGDTITINIENKNDCLVLEKLLVLREVARRDKERWIVNRNL